jgi:hypothetical protein
MATCLECGHADPEDRDFCVACGAYLRWDEDPEDTDTAVLTPLDDATEAETRVLTPVAVTAAQPAPEPVVIQHERVSIALESASASVEPGGRAELAGLVRNQSGIVDSYALRLEGMPAEWWTAVPAALDLVPFGAEGGSYEGRATIAVHPPRAPEAHAGRWPVQLIAVSRVSGETVAAAAAEVVIGAYERFECRIRPERAHGTGSARFTVPVRNLGNARLALSLRGEDADGEARFDFDPPGLEVPAGGEAHATLTVSAPAPVSGAARERRLTVFADGPEQTLSGMAVFVQRPRVTPGRRAAWRVLLGLLAVLLIASASFMRWNGNGDRGLCLHGQDSCLGLSTPVQKLDDAVNAPSGGTVNGIASFVLSAGFATLLLALIVLLGLRRGAGAWFGGVITVVGAVILLIVPHDSGPGVVFALIGGILAIVAALLARS